MARLELYPKCAAVQKQTKMIVAGATDRDDDETKIGTELPANF